MPAWCGIQRILSWTQTRQTNGFIEALTGLFQAAKRKARGYTRFTTIRTVLSSSPASSTSPASPSRHLTHTKFNRTLIDTVCLRHCNSVLPDFISYLR